MNPPNDPYGHGPGEYPADDRAWARTPDDRYPADPADSVGVTPAAPYPAPTGAGGPDGYPYGPPPPGTYPPPPAPPRKRPALLWASLAGAAIVVVAVVVTVVVLTTGGGSTPAAEAPRSTTTTVDPAHSATDCTAPVSSGTVTPGPLSAGALRMTPPAGWQNSPDERQANGIDAVLAYLPVTPTWIAQVGVGETNLSPQLDLGRSAELMATCMVNDSTYGSSQTDLGGQQHATLSVDGVPAARFDVDVLVTPPPATTVSGDHLVAIVIDTQPRTYFLGAYPIGASTYQALVEAAIKSLTIVGTNS